MFALVRPRIEARVVFAQTVDKRHFGTFDDKHSTVVVEFAFASLSSSFGFVNQIPAFGSTGHVSRRRQRRRVF